VVFGLFSMFSDRLDGWFQHRFGESKIDKAVFTPKQRYFIRRYIAGFQIAGIGTILIAIGLMIYFNR
jgi:hypothetical protein